MWWGTPCYPAWQPAESWHWKPNPEMQTDAWGCPVMPPAQGVCPPFTHNASGLQSVDAKHYSCSMPPNYFDLQPPEEVIDRVVKEAISKPWLPPPLGLKPPSTQSVLTELSKQGISTAPNHINGSHPL
ncbi:hypothetical protein F0562_007976 [Nyssa sinensis]|uniref:Uncharacterized protein n=1 Tax=Nyssa sinensis TaxID=561372 RepID=A0A5J5A6U8_9ASTE|nr:hypothetical protein F0562_007976 [Nyssa sinensis]